MKPVICLMRTFPQYFKNHVFEVKHKLQFWGKNVEQTHHVKILLLLPEKKKNGRRHHKPVWTTYQTLIPYDLQNIFLS